MKKIFGPLVCFICFFTVSHAQIAFVDTRFILNKIPDFTDSIAKLNTITAIWQREIDEKQAVLEKMYKDFEKDEAMLSDELKKNRSEQIFIHEKELRDLQRTRFGYQGDLYKKRQEMVKPIEDRVNAAIQSTANRLSYKIVLDKSEGNTVMFSKVTLDITEEVEKEMGMIK